MKKSAKNCRGSSVRLSWLGEVGPFGESVCDGGSHDAEVLCEFGVAALFLHMRYNVCGPYGSLASPSSSSSSPSGSPASYYDYPE